MKVPNCLLVRNWYSQSYMFYSLDFRPCQYIGCTYFKSTVRCNNEKCVARLTTTKRFIAALRLQGVLDEST